MRIDTSMAFAMRGQIRLLVMLVVAFAFGTPSEPLRADEPMTECIDLSRLVELVVANDPALEALRRAIAAADLRVAQSTRGRPPELRLHYGDTGDWSVPGPYTETSFEASTTAPETITRETVSVVTPDSEGETTRETVIETSGGEQVVSETIERRSYGRDVYGGGNHYTAQLRLFPGNPWIRNAERKRELALKHYAETILDAALQRAALSVAREHRAIQFMRGELQKMLQHKVLLQSYLQQLADMKQAQAIAAADYHKQHAEALVYLSRISELKRNIRDADASLKTRAGLEESAQIEYAGSLAPPRADLDALDPKRLLEIARLRHQALLSLRSEQSGIRNEISAERAAGIPWFSILSMDYGIEDSVNGQTRDEWSVYAGIELPVGAWLDRDSRRALNARLRSAQHQEVLTEQQLALAIEEKCRALVAAQSEWISFADNTQAVIESIEQQMAMIDDDDLAARRTRISLSDSLLAMDMRRLELAHRTSDLLFDLCDTVGHELGDIVRK